MPIYEYTCKKCGKTIEVLQKFSDPDLKKHEKCGGALTKLISQSGFQFKGTGWYVTDYAKKSGGSAETKDSKESSAKTESSAKESSPAAPAKSSTKPDKKSSGS